MPLLVLGGGSNVVVGDDGFDGRVVRVASRGCQLDQDGDRVRVTAEAGEAWTDLVDRCIAEGLAGVECLAGIPGLVGATPVQNVGAYGQEVAQTISGVQAWDREHSSLVDLDTQACRFGYRDSRFKQEGRQVVLAVTFSLRRSELSEPIRYRDVAVALDVGLGERRPLAEVREAVLAVRRSKGMVLDAADPDTRSVGSFFTNPVLTTASMDQLRRRALDRVGSPVPSYPADEEHHKVPAAWLIEHAGFERGFCMGDAAISTKHTLALTVRRGRRAQPLVELARLVRNRVEEVFAVTLVPEPVLIGVAL